MKNLDFSSWQNLLSTLVALALVTVIGVGIRLLVMATIQQRRERANRQINERLRLLMSAYKTLGGSFTGELSVDPTHLRDFRRARAGDSLPSPTPPEPNEGGSSSDRARRIRDAVEAALSDIILLGTEEQVRLAGRAAQELVEGRNVHTHDLVVSLRAFIREALDLAPVPADFAIPRQGPTRLPGTSGKGKSGDEGGRGGSGDRQGGANGGLAIGMGMAGAGAGLGHEIEDQDHGHHPK
jgi:hypothetical protein